MSAVKKTSTKISAADSATSLYLSYIRYKQVYLDDAIGWPHEGAANMVYLDGHAITHKYTEFKRSGDPGNNTVTYEFLKPDK